MDSRFIDQLISIQKEVMSYLKEHPTAVNSKNSRQEGFNGIREEKGIFLKDTKGKFIKYKKENTEDYKTNGFVSNKFQSVQKRVQTRDLSRLSIVGVKHSTLYRKNMTLLFLPVITSHGRAIEINETQDNELECFAGYDYKGNTLDKYLREMKFLQSSQIIINKMAGFWYRLWEEKTGEHVTQVCYYFDGQRKPLWSDYSVKKSKVSKVGRVMGCLEQVYVHSDRGYPLMLQTFSGGVHLPEAIKKLHNQLDKILPHQVNRISVFDGGANSVEFYETFKDNAYFICILDNNQYKQDLSDMTIIERQEKNDGALYIEAEKTLKNSKNKKLYKVRIVVYKKPSSEKYIAFVTNIPIVNLTAEFVVQMYYKRWPNQEEQFRDMNSGAHLSTNYGFGKTHVINLVIQKKKKELDRQINLKRENIKKISDKISILEKQKNQNKKQSIKQEFQTKIRQIEKRISELPGKKQVKTLLKELKQLYITLEQSQTEMIKNELKTKAAIEKLQTQRKRQEHLYEKHMAEFTRNKR
jgi:hypothetical protein